jgi:hypothetical protein
MGLAGFRAGWAQADGPAGPQAVEKSCQCEVGNEGRNSLTRKFGPQSQAESWST